MRRRAMKSTYFKVTGFHAGALPRPGDINRKRVRLDQTPRHTVHYSSIQRTKLNLAGGGEGEEKGKSSGERRGKEKKMRGGRGEGFESCAKGAEGEGGGPIVTMAERKSGSREPPLAG